MNTRLKKLEENIESAINSAISLSELEVQLRNSLISKSPEQPGYFSKISSELNNTEQAIKIERVMLAKVHGFLPTFNKISSNDAERVITVKAIIRVIDRYLILTTSPWEPEIILSVAIDMFLNQQDWCFLDVVCMMKTLRLSPLYINFHPVTRFQPQNMAEVISGYNTLRATTQEGVINQNRFLERVIPYALTVNGGDWSKKINYSEVISAVSENFTPSDKLLQKITSGK